MMANTKSKRYNDLTTYYQEKYHHKVAKISLNAGFSCPNKDGTKGFGGCTYCSPSGSGDTAGNPQDSLELQFEKIKTVLWNKWPNCWFIPYLQANSNTYAPLEKLKEIYERILRIDPQNCVAFAIATRPDCFTEEIYDYLGQLNQIRPIIVELGLQSSNPETAKRIHRASTNREMIDAVRNLKKRNIEVVVHIINGLPGETKKEMLETIDFVNQLDVDGIKIHSLLLLKNTRLYEEYRQHPFPLLSLEEYAEITALQIARLKPSVIIHRFSADATQKMLVAPLWTRKKLVVRNEIDKYLRKNDLHQGDHYLPSPTIIAK